MRRVFNPRQVHRGADNKVALLAFPVAAFVAVAGIAGCGGESKNPAPGGSAAKSAAGIVSIDGSSTVYPFAQSAAEQFQAESPDVKITVGTSGTGGGFEKFCAGETDISDASRPIEPEEEATCKKNGIEWSEIQVVNDGVSIATNPDLKIECLTTEQLKKLWEKGSTVKNYAELGAGIPSAPVSLFGAGTDSGTFDFFTDVIDGEEGNTREDYQPSEDDNVLVQGVSGDKNALGYFGFSYYESNKDKLNLVGVDGGSGCVKPSLETIQSGSYKPLSRPIFMYPSRKALKRPEVKAFMSYAVDNADRIASTVQMVPMDTNQMTQAKKKLNQSASGGATAP